LEKKKNILLSNIVSTENELSFIDSINIESDNPEKIIIRKEDITQLNQSINMLPEFQKTVVLLFYKEEMSLDEISKIMELPENTVKSHLFRAKNSLKQLMTKKETI
jgi:RNA polymerase sigma-70 factor (ECF subfamily)